MKTIFISLIIFLLSNCGQQLKIQQITSNEPVKIFINPTNIKKDSINLSLPTEIKMNINNNYIGSSTTYYSMDRNYSSPINDFILYNKKSKKKIYGISDFDEGDLNFVVEYKSFYISKKLAENILDKYRIDKKKLDLKYGDTIKTVPYNQFRKDNPEIVSRLNKTPDSITFNFTNSRDVKLMKSVKINW